MGHIFTIKIRHNFCGVKSTYNLLILGSCLQVDPSPHNFNSDPLPLLPLLPSSNLMRLMLSLFADSMCFLPPLLFFCIQRTTENGFN